MQDESRDRFHKVHVDKGKFYYERICILHNHLFDD